jgi:hypothetical protein
MKRLLLVAVIAASIATPAVSQTQAANRMSKVGIPTGSVRAGTWCIEPDGLGSFKPRGKCSGLTLTLNENGDYILTFGLSEKKTVCKFVGHSYKDWADYNCITYDGGRATRFKTMQKFLMVDGQLQFFDDGRERGLLSEISGGELCATDSANLPPKTSEWRYLQEGEECAVDGKLTITDHSMKYMEAECEATSARMIKPDKTYKFSFKCELRKELDAKVKAATAAVELKLEQTTSFEMRALHPDAAAALKQFAREVIDGTIAH